MTLSPRHEHATRPIPQHPYRSAAIFHGALALVIVVLSGVSSTGLAKGAAIALAYFVAATGWSWWRFRGRIRQRAAAEAASERGEGG